MAGAKAGINGQINNNIITNGLVINIDPSYPKSFIPGDSNAKNLSANFNNDGAIEGDGDTSLGVNRSFNYDGVDEYIDFADSSNFDFGNTFTWNYWFRFTNHDTFRALLTQGYTNSSGQNNVTSISSGGESKWNVRDQGDRVNIGSVSADVWYHQGCTCNGSNLILYLNGIQAGTGTATVNYSDSTDNKIIYGGYQNPQSALKYYFYGQLGPLLVYNRTLNAAEILQNYQAQKERFGL